MTDKELTEKLGNCLSRSWEKSGMTEEEKLAEEYADKVYNEVGPFFNFRDIKQAFLAGIEAGKLQWHEIDKNGDTDYNLEAHLYDSFLCELKNVFGRFEYRICRIWYETQDEGEGNYFIVESGFDYNGIDVSDKVIRFINISDLCDKEEEQDNDQRI